MPEFLRANGFITLRIGTAMVLYWIFHRAFINEKIDKKDLGKLLFCAVFGVAANMLCFFNGLERTNPINGAVLMLCSPLFVVIFNSIFIHKKLNTTTIIGIFLAAAGAMFLMGGKSLQFSSKTLVGDIYIIINAISYAIYLVAVKDLLKKYKAATVNKYTFTLGFLMVLPFGAGSLLHTDFHIIPWNVWLQIFYVLIFTTFVVYQLVAYSIKNADNTLAASYIYLQPVLAVVVALLWGKDQLSLEKVLFTILIFAGVYLTNLKK